MHCVRHASAERHMNSQWLPMHSQDKVKAAKVPAWIEEEFMEPPCPQQRSFCTQWLLGEGVSVFFRDLAPE